MRLPIREREQGEGPDGDIAGSPQLWPPPGSRNKKTLAALAAADAMESARVASAAVVAAAPAGGVSDAARC
jgi:hypothetical protein